MAGWTKFIPVKWIVVGVAGAVVIMIKRYFRGGVCRSKAMMAGKTVIVTGSNSGIGEATVCELAKRRARVIMACRDPEDGKRAVNDIRKVTRHGDLVVKKLDLASLASVRKFAQEVLEEEMTIDVLINNAGVFQCPFSKTEDGFEMQMGVNHLGHFLLTNLLLVRLKQAASGRVVVVSSALHKRGKIDFDNLNSEKHYDKKAGYNNSKLANNLFARELHRRVEGNNLAVYCLHPGMVRTNLGRHVKIPKIVKMLFFPLAWLLIKGPWDGCQTVLYCAIAEELAGKSGGYYGNCKEEPWSPVSLDDGVAKKLWEVSEKLTGLA